MICSIKERVTKELYEELKKEENNGIRFEQVHNVIDIYLDEYKNIDYICNTPIAEIEYLEGVFKIKSHITHRTENLNSCFNIIVPLTDERDVFFFINWYKTLLTKKK